MYQRNWITLLITLLLFSCEQDPLASQHLTATKSHMGKEQTYTNGVLPDIADPHILKHKGKYYLYGTHTGGRPSGIPVYTSNDLVNWSYRGWALSNNDSWGSDSFWAPEVINHNGLFYMYYAVEEHLAVATSKSPLGPFKQSEKKPMHEDIKEIDAHIFIDSNGKKYFLISILSCTTKHKLTVPFSIKSICINSPILPFQCLSNIFLCLYSLIQKQHMKHTFI